MRRVSWLLPLLLTAAIAGSSAACSSSTEPSGGGCCRVCRTGKPCGNTCISRSDTCRTSGGCACAGIQAT